MQPIITIFCSFTRQWAIDRWIENLAAVEHEPALSNLCFIVDGDEHLIANKLKKYAESRPYRSFHVKINEGWHPNETRLAIRRMRVADVKNQSKDLVAKTDGEIIIGLEDDTVFDRLSNFAQLYQPLLDDPTIGFVEGVQMGRWGANIIGAWDADDFNFPQKVWTLLPPPQDIAISPEVLALQEITAGGFYGYATRRKQYLQHEYYTSSGQPWGPDVNYGFWLLNHGFKCLIDWSLIFGHQDWSIIAYPDAPPKGERLAQVVYTKSEINGKWDREDHEPTRY